MARQNLDRFLEHVQAHPVLRVIDAESLVLDVVPGTPDSEHGAAAGDDVQRRDDLGEDAGVAVGHPGDQSAELDSLGTRGQGSQQRVCLQHWLVGTAHGRQLEEVVHHPHRVEPGLFRGHGELGNVVEHIGRLKP